MKLASLPEGVLIEILQRIEDTNNTNFQFFHINEMVDDLKAGKINPGKTISVTHEKIKTELGADMYEESLNYLHAVKDRLNPLVYIDIPDTDFKYADWVREKCYENNLVPIVPQHVISKQVYLKYGSLEDYQAHCDHLKGTCSRIWGVYYSEDRREQLTNLYAQQKTELCLVNMKDVGIPKYVDPEKWSLTTKEKNETLKL